MCNYFLIKSKNFYTKTKAIQSLQRYSVDKKYKINYFFQAVDFVKYWCNYFPNKSIS